MIGVLHTWTRDLSYHPHVHYLVPAGALAPDGQRWLTARIADFQRSATSAKIVSGFPLETNHYRLVCLLKSQT
jgi:hypothetical protein